MRRLLLLPALLLVAACDSAPPAEAALDPAAVAGRWVVAEALQEETATVTAAQDVPVLPDAARSTLVADGADQASFPYATGYAFEPAGARRSFTAADAPSLFEAPSHLTVAQNGAGDEVAVRVTVQRPGAARTYLARLTGADRDRVTFGRLAVAVDGVVVPHEPGATPPGEVTVSGRFEFTTRAVAAGETLRRPVHDAWPLRFVDALVLEAGGALRAELPGETPDLEGTWAVEGRTLRLRLPARAYDQTFEVDDAGAGLRLTAAAEAPPTDAAGLSLDARFHVEAGTATDARSVWTVVLR